MEEIHSIPKLLLSVSYIIRFYFNVYIYSPSLVNGIFNAFMTIAQITILYFLSIFSHFTIYRICLQFVFKYGVYNISKPLNSRKGGVRKQFI